jgi:hypothetical protein
MALNKKQITHSGSSITVTTIETNSKVPPAKYETGFKKVNSKSANYIPRTTKYQKYV